MLWPNPATILKAAIKSVPAVGWGLGIAGIVSIVAIVTVGWKIDPLAAVLGTIVMLVLMTMLVVFARLSTTADVEFRNPILLFMWVSLGLTLGSALLLFTSAFFRWPLTFKAIPYRTNAANNSIVYHPAASDPKVWDLEERVNDLRGEWETVPQYGESKRNEVLEGATKLGAELLAVDDSELGPSGHVIKREFSCYAFIIAAATETDATRKANFAKKAVPLCSSASDDLRYIFSSKNRGSNLDYTAAWARRKDQEPFVDYLSAMALCLEGVSTNDQQKKIAAIKIISDRVPTFYLNRYPPRRDSVLKECFENGGNTK